MKRILLLAILATFGTQLFAGHYQQKGTINSDQATFKVKDMRLITVQMKAEQQMYIDYDQAGADKVFSASEPNINEYKGASGKTHRLTKLFDDYKKRAQALVNTAFTFNSNEDDDVFVVFDKNGDNYTIDIYTGQDAVQKKASLNK